MLCFFFQAEDGIRDYDVTGVQTCALPISSLRVQPRGVVGIRCLVVRGVRFGVGYARIRVPCRACCYVAFPMSSCVGSGCRFDVVSLSVGGVVRSPG